MPSSKGSSKFFKLKSKDGEIFEVEEAVAMQSELIRKMVEDLAIVGCTVGMIPVPLVRSKTLASIIQWCEKHVDDAQKTNSVGDEEKLKNWESKFVDIERENLCQLWLASNYLNVEDLFNCVVKKVADMIIKAKNPEEIREIFGITNDFTPEEEEEIRKQNAWNDVD